MTATPQPLGRNDLLASFYTLSGAPNGQPARHPFDDRVRAASAAGYSAIGMTMFDIEAMTGRSRTLRDLAWVAADHGVRVAEVETLSFSPVLTDQERQTARDMFSAAEQLEARHVNAFIRRPPGTEIDLAAAAESFAVLCDLASGHGLSVAFEFMPFMAVATVDVAAQIVEDADRDNGGLVVDSYHFFRGGSRLEDLAVLPKHRFLTLQLSDVPAVPPSDLLTETRNARLLPGMGDLPLEEFIRAVDAAGSDATIGVEILSDTLRQLSAEETAVRTATATRSVLEKARQQPRSAPARRP